LKMKRVLAAVAVAAVAACDSSVTIGPSPNDEWSWTDLDGPGAAAPELVANHETLVVTGGELLLGTADGVWRRPLTGNAGWERAGLDGRAIHALALTADGGRIIAAGYDPRDATAPTVWYSTTGGLDWISAAVWPQASPGSGAAGESFRFA